MTNRDQEARDTQQSDAGTDRREFMVNGVGGAVFAGLLAASGATPAAQPVRTASAGAAEDPRRPEKLGPRGQIDSRFPISYEDTVPNGVRVLVQYFKALSQRDMKAVAATLQFPFGTYEGVEAHLVQTPEELFAKAPPSMNMSENPERYTDHDGYMKPGCYDVFKGIEVLNWNPISCCMSMTYDRYDKYGKRLIRCDGIYIVTNNDGHWGVELMSTIFTPNDQVGVVYQDSMEAAKRARRDHVLGGNYEHPEVEPNRDAYQSEGYSLSLSPGGQGVDFRNGPLGTIMDLYKIKGIKSRIRRTKNEVRGALGGQEQFRALFKLTGVGNLGFVFTNPHIRIIHHTTDKVHMWSGAARYTVAGEHISMNSDLQIITYRKGKWGQQGQVMYSQVHDRANDVANL